MTARRSALALVLAGFAGVAGRAFAWRLPLWVAGSVPAADQIDLPILQPGPPRSARTVEEELEQMRAAFEAGQYEICQIGGA